MKFQYEISNLFILSFLSPPFFFPFSALCCLLFFKFDSMAHHYNSAVTRSLVPIVLIRQDLPVDPTRFSAYSTLISKELNIAGGKTQPCWMCGCELREPNFSRNSALSTTPGHFTHTPMGPCTASLFPNSSFSFSAGSCLLFA